MRKILMPMFLMTLATACSIPSLDEVLSDTRTDYEKSQSLPPLDVPPDLKTAEPNEANVIPGETTTTTYKDYQNRTRRGQATEAEPATVVIATTPATPAPAATSQPVGEDGGSFVAVRGDKQDIWNRLRDFLAGKGYPLDLDDYELGYMETQWSAPLMQNSLTFRQKFKFYSEAGADAGSIQLYIDHLLQEQVIQGNGNAIWVDRGRNAAAEQLMAGEMNVYFNGGSQPAVQPQVIAAPAVNEPAPEAPVIGRKGLAEIQDIGDGKFLLAIPEEYTLAWRRTGQALQRAGLTINDSDQEQGLYHITARNDRSDAGGWASRLKKLKFWGRDETQNVNYQIALTGVGNKTELVLLDENGDWLSGAMAENILLLIQTQYNKL